MIRRVRPVKFQFLLFLIGPQLPGFIYNDGHRPMEPDTQLLIALRILGTSETYRWSHQM